MKRKKRKFGFTLTEMLITVGVITILVSMVMGVATHIDKKDKQRLTEGTIAILNAALQEYHQFHGAFPLPLGPDPVANSEILYEALHSTPNSRVVLNRITDSFIKHDVDTGVLPPIPEIYDAWGTVVDFRYAPGNSFPEVISAGPDTQFGTPDDIISRRM